MLTLISDLLKAVGESSSHWEKRVTSLPSGTKLLSQALHGCKLSDLHHFVSLCPKDQRQNIVHFRSC